MPFHEASIFLAGIKEIPNEASRGGDALEVDPQSMLSWAMEAAKKTGEDPRPVPNWTINAWTKFVDLIKVNSEWKSPIRISLNGTECRISGYRNHGSGVPFDAPDLRLPLHVNETFGLQLLARDNRLIQLCVRFPFWPRRNYTIRRSNQPGLTF